jgi:hypothetical protein
VRAEKNEMGPTEELDGVKEAPWMGELNHKQKGGSQASSSCIDGLCGRHNSDVIGSIESEELRP